MTGASRHILALVLLGIALALPAAQKDRQHTEQQLKELTRRLDRVQRQVARDAVKRDRMSRDLRAAEQSVASARAALAKTTAQRARQAAARQKLVDERTAKQQQLAQRRTQLANQLRGAYFMGRNEPLQLLLNQRNSDEITRMLTYYGYFGRQRAGQIADLNQDMARIDELTDQIDAEDAKLAQLEDQQKARVGDLEAARKQRGKVLASLEHESRSRRAQLARLKAQRQQLEQLLERLSKATESVPFDPNAPFDRARGTLAWPVAGRISVDYGAPTAGGLQHSTGIDIQTARGADVRAVYEGRVEYADWLPGRGLLIILNHGNGYLSLYSHNDQLYRKQGAVVQAGEVIAAAGDSGGRKSPGLYFEIRRAGKPVNPHVWLRGKAPPSR